MRYHNITMTGPFVNQKLSTLPAFIPERDQGRLLWLSDGTFWYGSDTLWMSLSRVDTSSTEDIYSDLLRTTVFLNASYDAFTDEDLVEATNMVYKKSQATYVFTGGNVIVSKNLFDGLSLADTVEYVMVYVEKEDSGNGVIQVSTDGGVNWSIIGNAQLIRISDVNAGIDIRLRYTSGGIGTLRSWGVLYNKDLSAACTKYAMTYKRWEANQDQTLFEVNYIRNALQVFVNGVMLDETQYFADNGTEVNLITPLTVGDIVYIYSYSTSILDSQDFVRHNGLVSFSNDQSMGDNKLTDVTNGTDPFDAVNYGQLILKANINSPTLTGVPASTTPDTSDWSTRIATTAFVKNQYYVQSVGATSPVVSSAGQNPVISMPPATATVNGYMTSVYATKLDGIESGSQVNVPTNLGQGTLTSTTIPLTSSTGTGTTLPAVTTSLAGLMSAADKTKMDGIEAGATGDQTAMEILTAIKTVDGAGSGLDADLLDGHDISYFQSDIGYIAENTANKGQVNGYASLDAGGKVPQAQIPAVAITNTFVVNSEAEMLALVCQTGDVAIRSDSNNTYILQSEPASTLSNWKALLTPIDGVTSVTFGDGLTSTTVTNTGTIANTDRGSSQNIFKNVTVPGQTTITSTVNNDSLNIAPGDNVTLTTSGKTLTITSEPGFIDWSITSTSITATPSNGYFVNTSAGVVTITLPATATIGDMVGIVDYSGTFSVNNCIVARNGHNIMGVASNFVCEVDNLGIKFVYVDATQGWRMVDTADESGGTIGWETFSSSILAEKGTGYFINTSAGVITVTLPASPEMGDTVRISDANGTFDVNKCIVARNGSNILGLAQDLACVVKNSTTTLVYLNATQGWKVTDLTTFIHMSTVDGYQVISIAGYS